MTAVEVGTSRAEVRPASRAPRRFADWSMTTLARLVIRVFFRSIEIENGEKLPIRGRSCWWPTTPTAWSTGSCCWRRCVATHASWASRRCSVSPPVAVPQAGRRHPGVPGGDAVAGDRNASAFATSHAILGQGGDGGGVPRGDQPRRDDAPAPQDGRRSHRPRDPGRRWRGRPGDSGRRARLRRQGPVSLRALVRVGDPVAVRQWAADYGRDEWATVRSVTEDLEAQLSGVNPSFTSWTQAKELTWIAEVVVRTPGGSRIDRRGVGRRGRRGGASGGEAGRSPGLVGEAVRCLRRLRARPEPARGQRRPAGGPAAPPPAPRGRVGSGHGPGRRALRRHRRTGAPHRRSRS